MASEDEEVPNVSKKRPLLSRKVRNWIAGTIGVLMLILVIQNLETVFVRIFFFPRMQMPLVVLMLFTFLLGMVVGYVLRRRR